MVHWPSPAVEEQTNRDDREVVRYVQKDKTLLLTAASFLLIFRVGTCTDANESIETRLMAKQTQQQLLSVIAHSHVTVFTTDLNRNVTMLEGALIWDTLGEDSVMDGVGSPWYIGENVYEVFNRLNSQLPHGQRPQFLQPIESILAGLPTEDLQEHEIGK